jgi:hypothetical protein
MAKYIICLLCLARMLAGCGKSAEEKAIEKAVEKSTGAGAEVDLSDKGMKISGKTEEGAFSLSTGEGTEIPKDFPADVLIYNPSNVGTAMNMPEGKSLALTTTDDSTKVAETYKREMTAKGWSEQASMNMGAQSMLVYEKGDRIAHITIAPMDDETQITVMVTKR